MQTLFELLSTSHPSAAQCAAALGISRQAYQQASGRRRLSDAAALRAAAILNLDPGRALVINATGKDPAAPIPQPAGHPPPQIQDVKKPAKTRPEALSNNVRTANYAQLLGTKKSHNHGHEKKDTRHFPISLAHQNALDIIKWCYAVADMRADSPRFAYYVSRWDVPGKIAHAKITGSFDETISQCPPIDPAWIRFAPAALEQHRAFTEKFHLAPKRVQSSSTPPALVKSNVSIGR